MKIQYKFITIIFLFLLFMGFTDALVIPSEFTTGSSISKPFNVSVVVLEAIPYLKITKPVEGDVYITSKNIPLIYTSANEINMWYNIDLKQNKSIKEFFNTSHGQHTLYLYANNSLGLTVKNVSFTINSSRLRIDYGDIFSYDSEKITTNFNESSLLELQNLHDIEINRPNAGKISFLEGINITDDLDPTDNFVDIDSNIKISFNRIEVNSENLPNFNKSAELTLYGLTFNNPRILKNGESCLDCSIVSYNKGTGDLKFIVNSFNVYSADETVSPPAVDNPSGGGGSSNSKVEENTEIEDNFLINESLIRIYVSHGNFIERKIMITNKNKFDIEFTLEVDSKEAFINFEKQVFNIKAGESQFLNFRFLGREDADPGLYFGKIIFKAKNMNKNLFFVLQLNQKKSLFDVVISLPEKFSISYPGSQIFFTVSLFNMGVVEREDVIMETSVFSSSGKIIFSKRESFAVQTSVERLEELTIPEDTSEGTYFILAKVNYSGNIAIASKSFIIKNRIIFSMEEMDISVLIVLLFILVLLIAFLISHKKILRKR